MTPRPAGEIPRTDRQLTPIAELPAETGDCCCDAEHLTARELEVLCCIAAGMSSAEAAGELGISSRTVDHHIGAMLKRCGAKSRVDLVGICYAAGILRAGLWPPSASGRRCIRVPAM